MLTKYSFFGVTLELLVVVGGFIAVLALILLADLLRWRSARARGAVIDLSQEQKV